jgi:hypothetical protein
VQNAASAVARRDEGLEVAIDGLGLGLGLEGVHDSVLGGQVGAALRREGWGKSSEEAGPRRRDGTDDRE